MFTHIVVGSNDLSRSRRFYDAVTAIGAGPGSQAGERLIYPHKGRNFIVTKPIDGRPATFANGGTIGIAMDSPEQTMAWHEAGCANGGKPCEDPPGVRDLGFATMYLAYLRDPDGNKLCGVCPVGK